MKGYKVFSPDWTCRGFQYEVGNTYEMTGTIEMCKWGFHFCKKLTDCFSYYNFNPANKVAEIRYFEKNAIHGENKSVTSKITIVREITWEEVLRLANTGNYNTGDRNTGHYNTGHCNTGHCNTGYGNTGHYNTGDYNTGHCNTGDSNTGHYNTGDYNTGDYNTGDRNTGHYNTGHCNTGFFNTDEGTIRMFNKDTNLKRKDIDLSFFSGLILTKFIDIGDMSEEEKKKNPNCEKISGYLKVFKYKEMWANWYNKQDKEAVNEKIKALPNFDALIFEEITGLILEEK